MRRLKHAIWRKIRYTYLRKVVKLTRGDKRVLFRPKVATELDLVAQSAIRKSIWYKDATLLRLDNVRYVKVPSKKIYVVLENNYATISNSIYSYRFFINEEIYRHLCEIYDTAVAKRAMAIDNEVFNNIKSNIGLILKDI